jgi:hypothetical protein
VANNINSGSMDWADFTVSGRLAAPCGGHRREHEVQVAACEVREVSLDLLGGRQFRGQQLVANVPDRGRLQDGAGA